MYILLYLNDGPNEMQLFMAMQLKQKYQFVTT